MIGSLCSSPPMNQEAIVKIPGKVTGRYIDLDKISSITEPYFRCDRPFLCMQYDIICEQTIAIYVYVPSDQMVSQYIPDTRIQLDKSVKDRQVLNPDFDWQLAAKVYSLDNSHPKVNKSTGEFFVMEEFKASWQELIDMWMLRKNQGDAI